MVSGSGLETVNPESVAVFIGLGDSARVNSTVGTLIESQGSNPDSYKSTGTLTMFLYNQGRNFSSVTVNPEGEGFVVIATNVEKDESMVVSNPFDSYDAAVLRAKHYSGSSYNPQNPDDVEQYLSERLGF